MADNVITLHGLNSLVKDVLTSSLSDMYWIKAETSDVRVNQNGHCYLEFIEKNTSNKTIIAKARAMIWANTFYLLKAFFEEATKQPFTSGLKVLVQVSVNFHELYGYSLVVHDVDPSYTLGDQALNRAAIIKRLEEDGVLGLNKELILPELTHRIAIISSPTAAGYEDFIDQLTNNAFGFVFYTKLYPAVMQGDKAEDSVIHALEQIYEHLEAFDVVVIIRGGGATSELSCFDSYLLAASCAQFPLPIISGIGHERDETVLDIVANTRAKTPTAVAEFLVAKMGLTAQELMRYQDVLVSIVSQRVQRELSELNAFHIKNSYLLKNWSKHEHIFIESISKRLGQRLERGIKDEFSKVYLCKSSLLNIFKNRLLSEYNELKSAEKQLRLISPDNILKKGYSLTLKNGKIVKSATALYVGDCLTTVFSDGQIESTVTTVKDK